MPAANDIDPPAPMGTSDQAKQRRAVGAALQARLTGTDAAAPHSLIEQSWQDFIYAEIWSRPALDLRARFLISLASAVESDAPLHRIAAYVRGALANDALSLTELQEVALHMAVYAGWDKASLIEQALQDVADERGEPWPSVPALTAHSGDPQQRLERGSAEFRKVMLFGGPPVGNGVPLQQNGILNFVFGEMWARPGLYQRARRFLTLVGVANSGADTPIATHFHAAMASGDISADELQEFVLQYAVHAGWSRASVIQGVVLKMISKVQNGLNWNEGD
jgi:4-carboxymuconolactone decarboxylase